MNVERWYVCTGEMVEQIYQPIFAESLAAAEEEFRRRYPLNPSNVRIRLMDTEEYKRFLGKSYGKGRRQKMEKEE